MVKKKSGSEDNESPLKKLREEAGLSQQELATRIGVAVATISRWERGAPAMLTVPQMKALCKVFGKSIEELPDEFGVPKRSPEGE
ncbi:helix-turn-helix transcriptional regulator [Microcoleus sp. FACHB-SPT15]|uniref:helix-turn-helix transcriptional regulator n=1 Tax=Microcoleus sp. FACHB-SPT15 TaxID=2692830 RepID=UPI0013B986C8|nr:helix-turn-helix domain-containing protein [Microcoleus sp. FACHB-SPT15]MBD1804834.1 helix-turn-helix transcriptional regulator [Microcoleus sp. FACHB-SPT15]NEQ20519.1 helix-turn-helix transcriptional regulator [Microcoleus sp. SIO2G3]